MSTKVKNVLKFAIPAIIVVGVVWFVFFRGKEKSSATTSAASAPAVPDADIKKVIEGWVNFNRTQGYTWANRIKTHLDWLKKPENAEKAPLTALYAKSINYNPDQATLDASRLGIAIS